MKDQSRLYEGMYILNADVAEDAQTKAFEKIKNGIINRGGNIVKIHDLGKRRLAYRIDNHNEGHYYLMYFDMKPSLIKELWQEYHLTEHLMRYMTKQAEEVLEELKFKQLPEQ